MKDFTYIHQFELSDFHCANKSKQYLLSIGNKHFEINENVYRLILILKKSKDLNEIAEEYSFVTNRQYSSSDIVSLIDKFIEPLWIDKEKITHSKSFIFKKDLISSEKLSNVTGILSKLFDIRIMIILSSVSVLFICSLFIFGNTPTFSLIKFYKIPLALALYFFSIVLHELGHVSACRYFKISHGNIGIAVYLYNPVFYADVTNCWKLNRFQRLRVNIGGMYFQLLYCLLIGSLIPIVGWELPVYVIVFILLSFLINLNPFFKLDGYWILSDLLGIPNLSKVSFNTIKYFLLKIFKGNSLTYEKNLSNIPSANRFILFLYIIISNIFFSYIFLYHLPIFCYVFFKTYIHQIIYFFNYILGIYSVNHNASIGIREFLFKSLYAIFLIVMMFKLLKRFYLSFKDIKNTFLKQS